MKKWKPPVRGEIKIKPGRRVIWLARPSKLSMLFSMIAVFLVSLLILGMGVDGFVKIYFKINKRQTQVLAKSLKVEELVDKIPVKETVVKNDVGVIDETLPVGRWLVIPTIGVKTNIIEEEPANYEKALIKGVWRAQGSLTGFSEINSTVGVSTLTPLWGTDVSQDKKSKLSQIIMENPKVDLLARNEGPLILVAHRYGYVSWSNAYRRANSFYNLPKMKIDDEFEVWWEKKRYKLKTTNIEKGTEIKNYDTDVILYTCALLYGDERVFVYANLADSN